MNAGKVGVEVEEVEGRRITWGCSVICTKERCSLMKFTIVKED